MNSVSTLSRVYIILRKTTRDPSSNAEPLNLNPQALKRILANVLELKGEYCDAVRALTSRIEFWFLF